MTLEESRNKTDNEQLVETYLTPIIVEPNSLVNLLMSTRSASLMYLPCPNRVRECQLRPLILYFKLECWICYGRQEGLKWLSAGTIHIQVLVSKYAGIHSRRLARLLNFLKRLTIFDALSF